MKSFLIIQERGASPYSIPGLSVIPSIILLCDLLNPMSGMSGASMHECIFCGTSEETCSVDKFSTLS